MAGAEDPFRDDFGLPAEGDSGLSGDSDGFGLSLADPLDLEPGTDVGGVAILRLLGEGGMGRVYEARQSAPERLVAVKVVRHAIASREQLRRFGYETEVLGRLRHPNIAQIHTAGTFRHGPLVVPFFVMELVAGARPITDHVRAQPLGLPARVALFGRVCEAVAHGHRKGVIHRDLKPANILVDASGDPKVIDFGVARSLAVDQAGPAERTAAGQLVGTLPYMSPEQLDGRVDEIDARADVYALGLVLHELVTDGRAGQPALAAARQAEERAVESARDVERAAVDAGCGRFAARSLAAIVGTCLAADAADRYETAVAVAAELARWTAGDPVLARPPTWGETIARLVRRHRVAAVASVAAAIAIAGGVAGVVAFSLAAARQAAAARAELYAASVLLAAESRDRDALPEARRRLAAARALVADSGSRRPIELGCVAASLDDSVTVATAHAADIIATAWSPDGTRLATGTRSGAVRIVAVPVPDAPHVPPVDLVGHDGEVWRIAWSPDGSRVATASADKTVRIWDAATGREQGRIGGREARMYGVAFSHDGAVLATSGADRTARLWDAATGREQRVLEGHRGTVYSVTLTRDGRTAATASQDGTVRLWDAERGVVLRVLEGHDDWVFQAEFSPDEKRLATASKDGTARIWSVATGRCTATLRHPLRVNAVAFTADGRHVVTGSHDGVLRTFAPTRPTEVRHLRGHDAAIWTVASAGEGRWIATGSGDRTARLWTADGAFDPVVATTAAVRAIAWSPDGTVVAVGDADSFVGVHDAGTLAARGRLRVAAGAVNDIVFFRGAGRLAAACDDGSVRILDAGGRQSSSRIPCHGQPVHSVAISPDETLVATASEDGTVAIRELASWDVPRHVLRHGRRASCARFSPDGRTLFTAGADHHASAWDAATGRRLRDFVGHDGPVTWVAVSPDGDRLATASADGTVGLWRVSDARLMLRLQGPGCSVSKVAYAPDGSRVAAVSVDGAAHLWDAASGRPFPVLRGHDDEALAVAFAPDGSLLATGAVDKTMRLEGVSVGDVFRRRRILSRDSR